MFDTNVIFNKSFEHAVIDDCAKVIAAHSNHGDLDVKWIVPEVVRHEREYQMRNEFRREINNVSKVELLLNANWGVSEKTINDAIACAVEKEFSELGIEVVQCNVDNVDWKRMLVDACFRIPPFQAGDKEKGFRDAILCETFVQLVNSLSGSDSAILVSNDMLVKTALTKRIGSTGGLRIVSSVGEVADEITLRVSHVEAQMATEIEAKAKALFLSDPVEKSLWQKAKIHDEVWNKFGAEIKVLPPAAISYILDSHSVGDSRLIKKEGSRVHFMTPYFVTSSFSYLMPEKNGLAGLINLLASNTENRPKGAPDHFQIFWSATLSRYKRLIRAKFDKVEKVNVAGSVETAAPTGQAS